MPSLEEAYSKSEDSPGGPSKPVSYGLLALGATLTFLGLTVATTAILQVLFDSTVHTSQFYGGLLSGFGVLLLIFGVLYSVPDLSEVERKGGYLGLLLCLSSLAVFAIQFPENWDMYRLTTIPLITFLYAGGIFLLLFMTFNAIINFRLKSDTTFTITHRIGESDPEPEPEPEPPQSQSTSEETEVSGGGIGYIGKRVPDGVDQQYGLRDPSTEDKSD